jgi:type II secretory pathway pseudopilin PulG
MIEIAICLAIIGIALVAIIGVLPMGLNVQKDNREETVINQDATVFMEAIRNGARGADDLTNYVFAVTNYWYFTNVTTHATNSGINGYTYAGSSIAPGYAWAFGPPINNGTRIIGLLSTPEYIAADGTPLNNFFNGGYSNYVVAYVRSISGPASEKPPQDNDIVRGGSFSYKIVCENVPVALAFLWQAQSYSAGSQVFYNSSYWQATATTALGDVPGTSALWQQIFYPQQLAANLHELRLTFLWPLLPNSKTGGGRQTFRTTVAGQIVTNIDAGQTLYFFQSQSFTNVSAP